MQQRPVPNPASRTVVHSRTIRASEAQHATAELREAIEVMCTTMFAEECGLSPEWSEWTHVPAAQHRNPETDELFTVNAHWLFTVEAAGPGVRI